MRTLKGVVIGAGYFSRFHYQAWQDIPGVSITALSDLDPTRYRHVADQFNIPQTYSDYKEMLVKEKPDFVDVVTPPDSHLEICKAACDLGIPIICQKPLASTFLEAQILVEYTRKKGVPFMVHENFRFQPWYREIKKLLDNDAIGELNHLHFRMRTGDGWPEDAYLSRQPYFRDMERFLVHETGIHFIDTFRYLAGEVDWVFAQLRKLNPSIAGEDWGMLHFQFKGGSTGLYDANRYNEPNYDNPRYTFGEMVLEGTRGSIRLYNMGKLTIQKLGEKETPHRYFHENKGFAGNCVYFTQKHFIDNLYSGNVFETNGQAYLKNLAIQEAVYQSSEEKKVVKI